MRDATTRISANAVKVNFRMNTLVKLLITIVIGLMFVLADFFMPGPSLLSPLVVLTAMAALALFACLSRVFSAGANPRGSTTVDGRLTDMSGQGSCDAAFRLCEVNGKQCVDELMKKLGISMSQQTDPEQMKDILQNEMKLDDCPTVLILLGSKLSGKESMRPMLETIQRGILSKQPEMLKFLSTALKEDLLPSPSEAGQKLIIKTLNHMVLLDAITKGMAEDLTVMEAIHEHHLKKRRELGIREGFYESGRDMYELEGGGVAAFFLAVKTKSVDAGLDLFLHLRKNGRVTDFESLMASAIVVVNIAEAVLADAYFGNIDNARAGIDLNLNPASEAWLSDNNRAVKYNYSQDWCSLYESWNMAFVSQLGNHHRRYAKLLIPQVINADAEDYIFNRALALWLTLNFDHFHVIEKRENVMLPNSEKIVELWGKINRASGEKLGR